MKKRVLSILLVALMVMGLCTVAFAANGDDDPSTWTSDATTFTITKEYKDYAETPAAATVIPSQELTFTITANSDNPDTTKLISIEANNSYTPSAASSEITVTVPSYSEVGLYKYTIKESASGGQGITYAENEISVSVLVTYDYTNKKLVAEAGVDKPADGDKQDTFVNKYDVGDLSVKKTVGGSLGDKSQAFKMTVTLTATGTVYSPIKVSGGSTASNEQTIAADWQGNKEITIYVKDSETVKIEGIPQGVTYVVAEDASYATGANNPASADPDKGYTVEYDDKKTGTIEADDNITTEVKNTKDVSIETGINMDSLPYIVIAVIACLAVAVAVIRKRRMAE